MLMIRDVQMRALEVGMHEGFLKDLQQSLALALPLLAQNLGTDEFNQRVATALDRALERDIQQESALTAFIRLSLVIGPRFDELLAALTILSSDHSTPDERILRLATEVTPKEWAQAVHDTHTLPWDAIDAVHREV